MLFKWFKKFLELKSCADDVGMTWGQHVDDTRSHET